MKIHAIQTGIVSVKSTFLQGSARYGSLLRFLPPLFRDPAFIDLPIYAWVIEHPEGVIVVDTGDVAATKHDFVTRSRFDINTDQEIGAQLTQRGLSISDVSKVVLTHLHSDHAHGLGVFEHTPILISETEYHELKSPAGQMLDRFVTHLPAWFAPTPIHFDNKPLGTFEQSYALTQAGDVIAVPTPGHTAGHLSVIVREADCDVILAGDVTYSQAALIAQDQQGMIMAPTQLPITLQRMLAYTQQTPSVYMPSHDPESGVRLERREIVPALMSRRAEPAALAG